MSKKKPATWEKLLDISWPEGACDQSGECCRGASQHKPWKNVLQQAASGNRAARNFLNQFTPYSSKQEAEASAPEAVRSTLKNAQELGYQAQNLVFYRCNYLKGVSHCSIYEDRPQLCRDYPESPFSAIANCCGYANIQQKCLQKIDAIKNELTESKELLSKKETQ